jgi:murein DD-endopeptidase MepM/ murein hydrolase activator NlpD
VTKEGNGLIKNSLYETMINSGLNDQLTYYLADVYAWNIDFYRLHKGDRFKVIYTEKFVDDSISIGVERIKAAVFQHAGKDFYAFEFQPDSLKGIIEYFDDKANNLRRAFLKAPIKFGPVTSRYNLKRRISYYGNRVKPHRGTDFSANVGTPILATAKGVVVKSSYTRGNGNFVTIKHNSTYSTQYLHMKRRKVKAGELVKQGQVIGWVGMTGFTSGPHVCYRFWKNGRQVDPFKQKLPDAKPISNELKNHYLNAIFDIKNRLDCISFNSESKYINSALAISNSDIQ